MSGSISIYEIREKREVPICCAEPTVSSVEKSWLGGVFEEYQSIGVHVRHGMFRNVVLLMSMEGSMEIRIHDASDTGQPRTAKLSPGQICLLPKEKPMEMGFEGSGKLAALLFDSYLISSAGVETSGMYDPCFILRFIHEDRLLQGLMHQLRDQLDSNATGYVRCLMSTAASHIVHQYSSERGDRLESSHGLPAGMLKSAMQFIHEQCCEPMTVEVIANRMNLSAPYFSKMFKLSTGITPYQYLLNCRINKAKMLISSRKISLAQIAEQTGFHDHGHFTKSFKKIIGVTPSQFFRSTYSEEK
ncbi:MAG: helix-turn-helix transcriptional regulator [Verrucomicrobia bacterium]|nr:helix-turn-helix transcriptional regulator [Verrucomicrobiota bacterium]